MSAIFERGAGGYNAHIDQFKSPKEIGIAHLAMGMRLNII